MLEIEIIVLIIIKASLYLLVALSFSVIYYPTKFFHIAHAAVITIAAYSVFIIKLKYLIPFQYAVTAGIVISAFIGMLCELLVYRQIRKKNLAPLAYLITSLGLYVILQNTVSLFFGNDTKVIDTAEITVGHQIFPT